MTDCIFCKIAKKEMPTDFVYETENFVVFRDIQPHAPVHFLIVPKVHVVDIHEATEEQWSEIRKIALELAKLNNLEGFRIGVNAGDKAEIKHLHIHFLAKFEDNKKL